MPVNYTNKVAKGNTYVTNLFTELSSSGTSLPRLNVNRKATHHSRAFSSSELEFITTRPSIRVVPQRAGIHNPVGAVTKRKIFVLNLYHCHILQETFIADVPVL